MTLEEAKAIALKVMPDGSNIIKTEEYGNLYVLQIIWPDPDEGHLDPFFSVDKTTGEFRDFYILNGGPSLLAKFVG